MYQSSISEALKQKYSPNAEETASTTYFPIREYWDWKSYGIHRKESRVEFLSQIIHHRDLYFTYAYIFTMVDIRFDH